MATITIDLSAAGGSQVRTVRADAATKIQIVEIFYTPAGTYDQAASESIELTNAAAAIQNSRRNGKTVSIIDVLGGQSAYDVAGAKHWSPRAAIFAANIIEHTIFDTDGNEQANAVLPTYTQPMSVLVAIQEA